MKNTLLGVLDRLIPEDIKEFEQNEEMVRARSVVFFNLINMLLSLLVFLGLALGLMPPELRAIVPISMTASLAANAFALWVFYNSGLYAVAGNIYALSVFGSTLYSLVAINDARFAYLLIPLISLPMIVSLVANHRSAVVWLVIVTLSPELLGLISDVTLSKYYTGAYLSCCFAIMLTLYMENYYRESMRDRLNTERTHFEFAAAHDPLTGVPNRATFDRRLKECIDFCTLHDTKAVLVYIDLDKFKPINDTHGHQAGDIVLVTVANRLRHLVRASDTVARLGGDEFAILFEQCDPKKMDPIIDRVAKVIAEPIEVFDHWLTVQCSIGKVICPDDGQHPEQLSHKADERMYEQKRRDNPAVKISSVKLSG